MDVLYRLVFDLRVRNCNHYPDGHYFKKRVSLGIGKPSIGLHWKNILRIIFMAFPDFSCDAKFALESVAVCRRADHRSNDFGVLLFD
jgi:hypothetical protein